MTAKERANQLYNKMTVDFIIDKQQVKICSLICVEEILNELENYCESIDKIKDAKEFYGDVSNHLHKI